GARALLLHQAPSTQGAGERAVAVRAVPLVASPSRLRAGPPRRRKRPQVRARRSGGAPPGVEVQVRQSRQPCRPIQYESRRKGTNVGSTALRTASKASSVVQVVCGAPSGNRRGTSCIPGRPSVGDSGPAPFVG